jgi:arylsulfatase A-like enzyme
MEIPWIRRLHLAVALALGVGGALGAAERPNFLFILSDDQGFQDLAVQGSSEIPTPHIDSLARQGVRCTQAYVSAPMCSPSRAGLLTGRSQSRFGHEINWEGRDSTGRKGLPPAERTIAEYLRAAGYRTGCVGKWHLGDAPQFHPRRRGFEEYFGHLGGSHDYFRAKGDRGASYALEGWDGKPFEFEDGYLTEINAQAATEFIHRHRAEPWFLYLAFNAPHTPTQATRKYLERFAHVKEEPRRTYCAMVSALDDAVGRLLAQLRADGLEEKTFICFLSDNGGPLERNGSSNTPLTGEKGHLYEGGIRVPFLVQWKTGLPAGRRYDRPVSILDLSATALALAGVAPDPARPLDGVNLLPFLRGEQGSDPHDVLFWRMKARRIWAVRKGDWKLLAAHGWHDVPSSVATPRLIQLANDPAERQDVSAQFPEKLAELRAAYVAWEAGLPEPLWGPDDSPEAAENRQKRTQRRAEKARK